MESAAPRLDVARSAPNVSHASDPQSASVRIPTSLHRFDDLASRLPVAFVKGLLGLDPRGVGARVLPSSTVVDLEVVDTPLAVRRRVQLLEAEGARTVLTGKAALRSVHPEFQAPVEA